MRFLLLLAAVIAGGAVLAGLLTLVDDDGPEPDRGLPIEAVDEPLVEDGRTVVARGRYSDGKPYEIVVARSDRQTRLCIGLRPGIRSCEPIPRPQSNRQMTVHHDDTGCPDTVVVGLTVPETDHVLIALGTDHQIEAHRFDLPPELGHDVQLFAGLTEGAIPVNRVVAETSEQTTVADFDLSREAADPDSLCLGD